MALNTRPIRAPLFVVGWMLIFSTPLMASYEDDLNALSRLHNLVVIQDGEIVLEHHQAGPEPAEAANIKSLSKSILSLLAGIAIDKGYFELNQPISELLGRHQPAQTPADLNQIQVEHLLSMQSGLQRTSGRNYGTWVNSDNWTQYALTRPMVDEPGGDMLYSTGNSHILAAILTEQTGRSLLQLMRGWVGSPLNIRIYPWLQSPEGIYFGGNDMRISARGLAWIGQLYVNLGMANGQQVVSENWIEQSFQPRTNSVYTDDPYGLGWFSYQFNDVEAFYGRGYGGQLLYVIPAYKLSIVMTSDPTPPSQGGYINRQHRFVEAHILPRFSDR
ncbi:serine hydrolase domain-containing protein [Aliidiomarina sedimenti]|uniref:serine hydrolase domain-containing protein n=1 Tax=Aliidiomarina sedimenti TaxID=1933879 RepID=UPI0018E5035E|nr:serine hydrolase [Aliidiomarina sedimenti]